MAQTVSTSTYDKSVVGASFSAGGLTIGGGASNKDTSGTKVKATDVGVKYSMGDVQIGGTLAKSGNDKYTNFGVKYTVSPGVTLNAESGQNTASAVTTDATWVALIVKF
jgi:hypothetical protein